METGMWDRWPKSLIQNVDDFCPLSILVLVLRDGRQILNIVAGRVRVLQ